MCIDRCRFVVWLGVENIKVKVGCFTWSGTIDIYDDKLLDVFYGGCCRSLVHCVCCLEETDYSFTRCLFMFYFVFVFPTLVRYTPGLFGTTGESLVVN